MDNKLLDESSNVLEVLSVLSERLLFFQYLILMYDLNYKLKCILVRIIYIVPFILFCFSSDDCSAASISIDL